MQAEPPANRRAAAPRVGRGAARVSYQKFLTIMKNTSWFVSCLAVLTPFAAAPLCHGGDSVPVTITTVPAGLIVTVDGTNCTAPASFDWLAGSVHTLDAPSPQMAANGHRRSVFLRWSDNGTQGHELTVPVSATNYTSDFTTQYLLETAVTPADGGTVSNYPAGPWYEAGQSVTLTARTNTGYRLYFWQGVETAANNTAQLTMGDYHRVQAQFIPADYPYLVVTNSGGAAPGNVIGNIAGRTADGTKIYYVILDNTGTNLVFASKTNTLLRFVTPQGFATANETAGFRFKDETLAIVDTFTTQGYTLDNHDVKLLPNGHALVFGSEVRTLDMSALVAGGKTAASVTGNVIQELDANKRLVFEWHTFDQIAVTNTFADQTQASFDYAHVNATSMDPIDNNLLASLRTTSEILKIDRRTGLVLWRLGGKMNQFTFLGEHPENAPYYTVGQHDVHRLPNGHLLYFDNGNIQGGGVSPSDRTYSRVVEYALDEVNRTATLVWEYRHAPDIQATCTGSVKRMANGNTLIDWGCAVPNTGTILTEVNSAGQVVFEMKHRQSGGIGSVLLGGGLTKQLWNSPELIRSAMWQEMQAGQTYEAPQAGVAVTVRSLTGAANNTLVVQRHLDAVRFAQFAGPAPQVLMEHVVLWASNLASVEATLDLSLPDTSQAFDTPMIHDPGQVAVYQRAAPGQGQFTALPTTYDADTGKVRVTTTPLGEFIFAYPDVSGTPSVPVIVSPTDQSQISQSQAVTLTWRPQGLVGSFDLQLATGDGFASLVLDTNGLGGNSLTLQNLLPNTPYFWRVRAANQGATSGWASASFTVVAPVIQVTVPAGGEVWQRFQAVTIRWTDNLSENVAIDLYKGGVSNRTMSASTASTGSYSWTVGQYQAIPPGSDYTIKVRSTSNPSVFDFSEPFSIITNLTSVSIATVPAGLGVTVDGTNYTAPAAFSWLPSSAHSLGTASPQVAGDGHSRYVLESWSDGGAPSHAVTTPFSATNLTARFATTYLLEIAVVPSGAGALAANPTGPWYDSGQPVALTAQPNAGYLFLTWQGVETWANHTAQLTMNGYHAVQATFMPTQGVPAINPASISRWTDGRVEFSLSGGAGVVTQASVWGATNLWPADWRLLQTVTLTNGSALFRDESAGSYPVRFYRVSVP